jgi:hypothetical protein
MARVDEFGRTFHQREWTAQYVKVEERDDEGDIIPECAFSSSAGGDVGELRDVEDHDSDMESDIEDYITPITDPVECQYDASELAIDSKIDQVMSYSCDAEVREMVAQGFEVCGAEMVEHKRVRFVDEKPCDGDIVDNDGRDGCSSALQNEPNTRNSMRAMYLEGTIGSAQIAMLKELGVYDAVLDALPMADTACNIMTSEDPEVLSMEDWIETDILLTLDSGCCDHICDISDAPGYANFLEPSPGSQRGQRFVVGNGDRVKNQGQIRLRMKSQDASGSLMNGIFQVAEITRPLMSVSKLCDQDMTCIFEKSHARIVGPDGTTVARFDRDGGLYTCTMKLRKPVTGVGDKSGFARPVP